MESSLNAIELWELRGGARQGGVSLTVTSTGGCATRGFENASYQQDQEHEHQQGAAVGGSTSTSGNRKNLSPSYDEEGGGGHEADGRSADYGFIFALFFLVTGIVLVVVAYTIPREAKVHPDSISARQMEKLENYYAQLGSHLDRCIIAGLGLLTMGGMFLSVLLTVSVCRGHMCRRRAAFVQPKRTYGSISLRMKQLATGEAGGGECEDGGEAFLVEHPDTTVPKSEPGPRRHPTPPAAHRVG